MYINNIPKLPETRLAMFADNTVMYVIDCHAEMIVIWHQEQLDSYVEWAEKERVTINAAVGFSRRRRLRDRLYIGDTPLFWSREVKYLWIVVSPSGHTPSK